MYKLTYEKQLENIYKIKFQSINLGELAMLEYGFYNWFPPNFIGHGCVGSWVLKDIYTKLEEINKEYNESINKYFENGM